MAVDVHQHLWPAPFLHALRSRATNPRLDGWTLLLDGEPVYEVNPADHDPAARAKLNKELDLALISLSSPLGIEHLPPDEAWPLIDAFHEGAAELPEPFGFWASAPVTDISVPKLEEALNAGAVGLQLPATAVQDQEGLEKVAPLLGALDDRPLFIHPGPASAPGTPGWWPAVVPYVQQMHAAWYAFQAFGRPRHPRLKVCFALLAGLAPLHSERQISRGGQGRGLVDPGLFVETSSYGRRAVDSIVRELGIDVVVNGSDRPYAEAPALDFGDAAQHAITVANPTRLLTRKEPSS
ncbi:amidohydrolase [Herbidospora mongoliensis]|uniref:amidohydrolase n=1 Tax=Herbidospora mongoliensis TaxID=688067 RepID=UPI0008330459|nr:amidohydrolase [Herbidospora mongoliensis]